MLKAIPSTPFLPPHIKLPPLHRCVLLIAATSTMQPGSANGPADAVAASLQMAPTDASASEWDNDSGRPAFLNVFLPTSVPVPATAVRATTPERERRTTRPAFINVFMPPAPPLPEMTMADLQRRLQDPSVEIITHPPPRN